MTVPATASGQRRLQILDDETRDAPGFNPGAHVRVRRHLGQKLHGPAGRGGAEPRPQAIAASTAFSSGVDSGLR